MTGHAEKSSSYAFHFFGQGDLITRQFYLVISLFVIIVFCLLMLDRFQAHILDSVRAYVAGEGFWSKGQKDASYHLERYARTGDINTYSQYLEGLSTSLGDRQARLALQSTPPDIEKARRGFLQGRNHPDDVDQMIHLFLDFGDFGDMKKAITIWTEADVLIDELIHLGSALDAEVQSAKPDPERIQAILTGIDSVNSRVSLLEDRFSATLGDAARKIERLTEWIMFIAALFLLLIGIFLSRRIIYGIHRAQKNLADSEARFRHVVESNIVGIAFWDAGGSVADANDAFLHTIGYTREELDNGQIDWRTLTPPELISRDEATLQSLRSQGYHEPYEKVFLHKDGHQVPVFIGAALSRDSEDRGVAFVLDLSAQKEAEQLQKIAESVFKATREAIFVTDETPTIKAVNPAFCRITGYREGEVLGRNPHILSSGHHDAEFYRDMWESLQKTGAWQGEISNRRKDGTIYQEWLSISAIYNDKNEISEYVAVFSDITELRKMEEHLRQAQKMEAVGTLVGGIAHDFNNTLAAIEGNLFLAGENMHDPEKLTGYIGSIQQLSSRSAEMVRQLMTFARKDIVRFKPLSLNELFTEIGHLAPSIIPENIMFIMKLCPDDLWIMGDATQWHQMALNLLNNARDALERTSSPFIECEISRYEPDATFRDNHPELAEEALAQVVFRDNGCGIPQEHMEHIFDPFYTTKDVGKGTGLGLSMVYGSMQRHHGAVEVKSVPGNGTSVHLYIPLAEEVMQEAIEKPVAQERGTTRPATVLVVDDNTTLRDICALSLQGLGYEVLTADDGSSGLHCFKRHRDEIGFVICDIVMPKMGGFELAKRIRRHTPDLPVVFITGYDPEQTQIPSNLMENSAILIKPFPTRELAKVLRRLADSGEK